MSKADEMFKKLGYKKQYENENIYYYMNVDLKDNYIVFETGYKSFTKISCYHDAGDITMQELQAINEKVGELRVDKTIEIWKDIPGYEGIYQASNFGNIKSLKRYKQNHSKLQIENQKAELAILNEKQKDFNKLQNTLSSYEGQFRRQEKENEKLRKRLNEENKRCMMLAIEKQDYFEKYRYHLQQNERLTKEFSNVILVQKVKDKIRHYQELQDNYIKKYDEINEGLQAMINVLQELIEESEE